MDAQTTWIMKERPILFSAEMVRAILDGRKTMTRRVIKKDLNDYYFQSLVLHASGRFTFVKNGNYNPTQNEVIEIKCPYGEPGDILWVREEHYRYGHWVKNGITKLGNQKWKFVAVDDDVIYLDNPPSTFKKSRYKDDPGGNYWYKRIARFMPKSACRIKLLIKSVRVERLQEISECDAAKDGAQLYETYRGGFYAIWQSIHGPESWESNQWVWVIEFKRIEL